MARSPKHPLTLRFLYLILRINVMLWRWYTHMVFLSATLMHILSLTHPRQGRSSNVRHHPAK